MQTIDKKTIKTLDFNCDLAQGYGVYRNNSEFDLLDYVSSVNISCGFHAGDPSTIKNALLKAKEKNIVIGAHIGYADIQGFGYRQMDLSESEIEALVIYQTSALLSFAKSYNLEIEHVRLHGAMYKKAGEDFRFATTVARAVQKVSKWLTYIGPVGDITKKTGDYIKIPIGEELLINKVYTSNLSIDYTAEDITNVDECVQRLQHYVHTAQINNSAGGNTYADIDTIHFANKYDNLKVLQRAVEIIKPEPVNYGKVKKSGWVD